MLQVVQSCRRAGAVRSWSAGMGFGEPQRIGIRAGEGVGTGARAWGVLAGRIPRLEAVPRLWGWQGGVDIMISLCPCCPRHEEEDGSKQGLDTLWARSLTAMPGMDTSSSFLALELL